MSHPYLPLTGKQRATMLQSIGVKTFEELLTEIPAEVRLKHPLNLPEALSELELIRDFQKLTAANCQPQLSFLGAGAYHHFIPAVVDHMAGRSEFYTAYTPYQPELSQGILQAIFEYQTLVSELFGLPVANASLYDGPTALAEAVLMAVRETGGRRVLLPLGLNPAYRKVLVTYLTPLTVETIDLPLRDGRIDPVELQEQLNKGKVAALVVQNPNFFGIVENAPDLYQTARSAGAVPIACVHPLTLGLLEAPGRQGAEIVVGEGQPLGLPVSYGGPYLGLMAVSNRFMRRIPGRLVGETIDREGSRAFVLTLQTREQHIRREKATSNICSNEALCAIRAAIYLAALGPEGLREVAQRCFDNAHYLQERLTRLGLPLLYSAPFFLEFAVRTPKPAAYYIEKLAAGGILPGYDLGRYHPDYQNALLICTTEILDRSQLDQLVAELGRLL